MPPYSAPIGVGPAIGSMPRYAPQVRAADAGGGEPDDGVGRLDDLRVVALFDADVAWGVQHCSSHVSFLS